MCNKSEVDGTKCKSFGHRLKLGGGLAVVYDGSSMVWPMLTQCDLLMDTREQ